MQGSYEYTEKIHLLKLKRNLWIKMIKIVFMDNNAKSKKEI